MCINPTKPRYRENEYLWVPRDPEIVIYYYEVGKKDVRHFRVAEYEDAYVICSNGEIKEIRSPGFYEVRSVPAKIIWIRTAKLTMTIGVPRGILPQGWGVHADIALTVGDSQALIGNIISAEKKGIIRIEDIKKELRRMLENAVRNSQIDLNMDRVEIVEKIHREMVSLIKRSWLNGFICDVQSVGFSLECEIAKILEKVSG